MTVHVSERLRDALERLDQAIDRLDASVPSGEAGPKADAVTEPVAPTVTSCDAVPPEVGLIAARLDKIIERIETVLAD